MAMMKAAVIRAPGGPEILKIESLPIPEPRNDQVLIRVKTCGLNRSELFTRQGYSPSVKFPRVLGIEAVGLVQSAPGNQFRKGERVATAMGGMGREFDGGYAEYTCVPATQVQAINIAAADQIVRELVKGKCLPQLLSCPFRREVGGHILSAECAGQRHMWHFDRTRQPDRP